MKKAIALCLSLVMVLSMVGCSSSTDTTTTATTGEATAATTGETTATSDTSESTDTTASDDVLTIGFSWSHKNDSLFYAMADTLAIAMDATIADHGYSSVEWIDAIADDNAETQANDIADFISRDVDLIVVYAFDSVAIGASIDAANKAGIPIVLYDRDSDDSVADPDMFIGLDTTAQAYDTGMAFFQNMKDEGVEPTTILSIIGALNDQNALNRIAGFTSAAAEFGWDDKIVEVPSDWDSDTALANFTTAWQANPDTNTVLIASDFIITSVQSVLEANDAWFASGEEGHIWICSQDGFPVGIEYAENGYIDYSGVYNLDGMAELFAENVYTILEGGTLDNYALTCGPQLQTPENIATESWWGANY